MGRLGHAGKHRLLPLLEPGGGPALRHEYGHMAFASGFEWRRTAVGNGGSSRGNLYSVWKNDLALSPRPEQPGAAREHLGPNLSYFLQFDLCLFDGRLDV